MLVIKRKTISDAYEEAVKKMDHEAALKHVAALFCIDVETVACVLEEEVTA